LTPLLSGNAVVRGALFAHGDGLIDTDFNGPASSEKLIGVGPNGTVKGPLDGRDIYLAGHYEGDATATQHLEMKSGCHVRSRCRSRSLEIEGNANYEGLLIIGFEDKDLTSSWKLKSSYGSGY
jgi:cytoskeletal protein CcmA (bactofilin family)